MSRRFARRASFILPTFLYVVATACACNPYRHSDRLPPARCRTHADCPAGESCRLGTCGLTGWVTGRVVLQDPGSEENRSVALDLRIYKAQDLLLPERGREARALQAGVAVRPDRTFSVRKLTRGDLVAVAFCRGTGRAAGSARFFSDGGRGYVPATGGRRVIELHLPVDARACRAPGP